MSAIQKVEDEVCVKEESSLDNTSVETEVIDNPLVEKPLDKNKGVKEERLRKGELDVSSDSSGCGKRDSSEKEEENSSSKEGKEAILTKKELKVSLEDVKEESFTVKGEKDSDLNKEEKEVYTKKEKEDLSTAEDEIEEIIDIEDEDDPYSEFIIMERQYLKGKSPHVQILSDSATFCDFEVNYMLNVTQDKYTNEYAVYIKGLKETFPSAIGQNKTSALDAAAKKALEELSKRCYTVKYKSHKIVFLNNIFNTEASALPQNSSDNVVVETSASNFLEDHSDDEVHIIDAIPNKDSKGTAPLNKVSASKYVTPVTKENSVSKSNMNSVSVPEVTIVSGPKTTTVSGPKTTTVSGPKTTTVSGPKTTAVSGPKTTTVSGPKMNTSNSVPEVTIVSESKRTSSAVPKMTSLAVSVPVTVDSELKITNDSALEVTIVSESEISNDSLPKITNVSVPEKTSNAVSEKPNMSVPEITNYSVPKEPDISLPGITNHSVPKEPDISLPGITKTSVAEKPNVSLLKGDNLSVFNLESGCATREDSIPMLKENTISKIRHEDSVPLLKEKDITLSSHRKDKHFTLEKENVSVDKMDNVSGAEIDSVCTEEKEDSIAEKMNISETKNEDIIINMGNISIDKNNVLVHDGRKSVSVDKTCHFPTAELDKRTREDDVDIAETDNDEIDISIAKMDKLDITLPNKDNVGKISVAMKLSNSFANLAGESTTKILPDEEHLKVSQISISCTQKGPSTESPVESQIQQKISNDEPNGIGSKEIVSNQTPQEKGNREKSVVKTSNEIPVTIDSKIQEKNSGKVTEKLQSECCKITPNPQILPSTSDKTEIGKDVMKAPQIPPISSGECKKVQKIKQLYGRFVARDKVEGNLPDKTQTPVIDTRPYAVWAAENCILDSNHQQDQSFSGRKRYDHQRHQDQSSRIDRGTGNFSKNNSNRSQHKLNHRFTRHGSNMDEFSEDNHHPRYQDRGMPTDRYPRKFQNRYQNSENVQGDTYQNWKRPRNFQGQNPIYSEQHARVQGNFRGRVPISSRLGGWGPQNNFSQNSQFQNFGNSYQGYGVSCGNDHQRHRFSNQRYNGQITSSLYGYSNNQRIELNRYDQNDHIHDRSGVSSNVMSRDIDPRGENIDEPNHNISNFYDEDYVDERIAREGNTSGPNYNEANFHEDYIKEQNLRFLDKGILTSSLNPRHTFSINAVCEGDTRKDDIHIRNRCESLPNEMPNRFSSKNSFDNLSEENSEVSFSNKSSVIDKGVGNLLKSICNSRNSFDKDRSSEETSEISISKKSSMVDKGIGNLLKNLRSVPCKSPETVQNRNSFFNSPLEETEEESSHLSSNGDQEKNKKAENKTANATWRMCRNSEMNPQNPYDGTGGYRIAKESRTSDQSTEGRCKENARSAGKVTGYFTSAYSSGSNKSDPFKSLISQPQNGSLANVLSPGTFQDPQRNTESSYEKQNTENEIEIENVSNKRRLSNEEICMELKKQKMFSSSPKLTEGQKQRMRNEWKKTEAARGKFEEERDAKEQSINRDLSTKSEDVSEQKRVPQMSLASIIDQEQREEARKLAEENPVKEKPSILHHSTKVNKNLNQIPISSDSVGSKMLKMMGWKGGGLGKDGKGITEPIKSSLVHGRYGLGHSNRVEVSEVVSKDILGPNELPAVPYYVPNPVFPHLMMMNPILVGLGKQRMIGKPIQNNPKRLTKKERKKEQARIRKETELARLIESGIKKAENPSTNCIPMVSMSKIVDERFVEGVRSIIANFVEKSKDHELMFSSKLCRFQRKIIHQMAEGFNLTTLSFGNTNATRHIVLFRHHNVIDYIEYLVEDSKKFTYKNYILTPPNTRPYKIGT